MTSRHEWNSELNWARKHPLTSMGIPEALVKVFEGVFKIGRELECFRNSRKWFKPKMFVCLAPVSGSNSISWSLTRQGMTVSGISWRRFFLGLDADMSDVIYDIGSVFSIGAVRRLFSGFQSLFVFGVSVSVGLGA